MRLFPAVLFALLKKTRKWGDVLQIQCGRSTLKWKPHWKKMLRNTYDQRKKTLHMSKRSYWNYFYWDCYYFFSFLYKLPKQNTRMLVFPSVLLHRVWYEKDTVKLRLEKLAQTVHTVMLLLPEMLLFSL